MDNFKKGLIILLISLGFSYYLVGNNLNARWAMIDDHEIMMYLDGNERISLPTGINILKATEFGTFGKTSRFRPIYFLLRVGETLLWGDNVVLWYISRFMMFVFSFWLAWILVKRFVGWVNGLLILMLTMSFPFWIDIWVRLGPAETYAVPASVVFLWSYINLIQNRGKPILNWILLVVGSVVMAGSKEVFLFLMPMILFLDGYLINKKRFNKYGLLSSLLAITFIGYIMVGVGIYILKTGVDVYQNKVDTTTRLLALVDFGNHVWKRLWPFDVIGIVGLIFGSFWIKRKAKNLMIWMWILIFLVTVMVASQVYFYNGMWPTGMRYDFPGLLAFPIMATVFVKIMDVIFFGFRNRMLGFCLKSLLTLVLALAVVKIGYKPIIAASKTNAVKTSNFYNRIVLIKKELKDNGNIPVVFESCNPWDVEPVVSVSRYLNGDLENRDLFLRLSGYGTIDSGTSDLERELMVSMNNLSKNGGGSGGASFIPIKNFKKTNDCYGILFSCERSECNTSHDFD